MRRVIILSICAAFVLGVFGGGFALATVVARALPKIGAAICTIVIISTIPVLVALALVFSTLDSHSCIALLWQVLKLLGWS